MAPRAFIQAGAACRAQRQRAGRSEKPYPLPVTALTGRSGFARPASLPTGVTTAHHYGDMPTLSIYKYRPE